MAVSALQSLLEQHGHQVISYTEDSREILHYTTLQKMEFLPRTVFSRSTYRRLKQLVAQEKPDVAHVHNVFPLLSPAVYVAMHHAEVPIVQTIHNYRLMCLNGLFLRDGHICERCKYGQFFSGWHFKCYRESSLLSGLYGLAIGAHRHWRTFARVDRFIALTSFVAEKLIESGVADPTKVSVLGNFLPEPLPDYGLPSSQEVPYVVYVGRLTPEKGLWTLLETFRDRELRTLQLKILGTGPLMVEVQAYKHAHNLDHVELLGFVEGEEKYRILRGARGCIVPSEWYEVFPFSVLESAVVGTPVIASRIGSLASLVSEGKRGLLFTPGDKSDLRAKLLWLIAHPSQVQQMGQQARQWVEAEHTATRYYQDLMQIYRRVMR